MDVLTSETCWALSKEIINKWHQVGLSLLKLKLFSIIHYVLNIKTLKSVQIKSLRPVYIILLRVPFLLYECKKQKKSIKYYYHILLFTNMFRSLLQRPSGCHTGIQTKIYFKCANIECCKIDFLFHWRLHTAEILQLELTNDTLIMQGKIWTLAPLACYFHR